MSRYLEGVLSTRMLHEPTGTEVWSTGGERFGIRDGAAAIVIEETRWHAWMSARTPIGEVQAGCVSELAALAFIRGKMTESMAAIDARIAELSGQESGAK